MQNAGVAGLLPGHKATIVIPPQGNRSGGAAPLGQVAGASRVDRDTHAAFERTTADKAARTGPAGGFDAFQGDSAPDLRDGAPSSTYLTQHIAQEVTPEDPGFDRFQAGARAYIMRRDSTVEILTSANRLDIRV